jgi:hypothetical protein
MKLRLLISLSLLLLAWQKAGAQLAPADDFFNSGAQFYISNNVPAALERVEAGLKTYPDNEKLKKLEKLLKQKQQNQQNQSQQQKNDQQKGQQQNQQKNSPQQKPEAQKQNQAEQKKEEQQKQQEQQQKSAAEKQKEKQEGEGQPVKPGQMTPEEAKRLLDAQKGNEQMLQLKPEGKPNNPLRPVKDW